MSETLLEDLEEKGKALVDASAEEIEKWKKEERWYLDSGTICSIINMSWPIDLQIL